MLTPNLPLVHALTLNDECNNQRISENKEVAALFLAIDKWCFWNPYFGVENCPEDFDVAVTTKYSFSTSGVGKSEYTINPSLIAFGVKQ